MGKIMLYDRIKVDSQIWTGQKRWLRIDLMRSLFTSGSVFDEKPFGMVCSIR